MGGDNFLIKKQMLNDLTISLVGLHYLFGLC
jgi:hypothetical protein